MAKVLLVDDDIDLVAMNTKVLEAHGHRVLAAYSSDEARLILRDETPDVAVLDVMMESLSAGFNLAREINRLHPAIPIFMVSAIKEKTGLGFNGSEDDHWLPVFNFLDKPFSPDKLAEKIASVLTKK